LPPIQTETRKQAQWFKPTFCALILTRAMQTKAAQIILFAGIAPIVGKRQATPNGSLRQIVLATL
jgi:hypothetical protein